MDQAGIINKYEQIKVTIVNTTLTVPRDRSSSLQQTNSQQTTTQRASGDGQKFASKQKQ